MMVLSMPWHLVGLLGMPRRMAYYDYTPPGAAAAGLDGDRLDHRRLHPGRLGAPARLHPGDGAQRGAAQPVEPFTFSAPAHPGAHTPVALNGFGLWVAMMIGLTLVNYGYPIAQLALLEGRVRARRSRSGAGDARARRCTPGATRGSDGAWSSLVVLTVLSMLVGFVWLPSVHGDFTAQGPVGQHLPRGRRAGDLVRRRRRRQERAPAPTDVVLERSMARVGGSDAVGRGATLALNCTMCHGAQGMSASDAPNLAGQYPEVVIKQLHGLQDRQARQPHHGGARQEPVATGTSATWPPTTPTCRRRAPRRRPTTKRCRRWCAWATRCATSRPASPATAASTRSWARHGSKACRKDYLVAQLQAFAAARGATTRRRRCATWCGR